MREEWDDELAALPAPSAPDDDPGRLALLLLLREDDEDVDPPARAAPLLELPRLLDDDGEAGDESFELLLLLLPLRRFFQNGMTAARQPCGKTVSRSSILMMGLSKVTRSKSWQVTQYALESVPIKYIVVRRLQQHQSMSNVWSQVSMNGRMNARETRTMEQRASESRSVIPSLRVQCNAIILASLYPMACWGDGFSAMHTLDGHTTTRQWHQTTTTQRYAVSYDSNPEWYCE